MSQYFAFSAVADLVALVAMLERCGVTVQVSLVTREHEANWPFKAWSEDLFLLEYSKPTT